MHRVSGVEEKYFQGVAHRKRRQDEQMREGFSLSSAPGEIIAKNISPRVSGGKREIIDDVRTGRAAFKESKEGEVKE